ncbi:MAG: hypothetical protein J5680_07780 [Neisseriaceae bacterium]|nr:hypothetical protein [Neisseriaceae bacterium]
MLKPAVLTGLPRFELRSNLAMTLGFISGCLKNAFYCRLSRVGNKLPTLQLFQAA